MKTISMNQTKQWLKSSQHPFPRFVFKQIKSILHFELPAPKLLLSLSYRCYKVVEFIFTSCTRIFIWTPLFKGRVEKVGKQLNLYGGLPYISGPLRFRIGERCRISGHTTFSARCSAPQPPVLVVGNNVDIGWMTTIAVGQRVQIGNNVRIAGRSFIAGYPGHPLDPKARALGLPETDDQVADIIIEDDVWLATGVSVMAGVKIGQGSIVAAGSVVTHDLPEMVLAAGIPAKVIRSLDANTPSKQEQ